MRIPLINTIHSALEGFPPPPQETPPLNQFYIGEDVFIEGFLKMDGVPVSILDWEPTAVIKSNAYASPAIWEGVLNNGIYMTEAKPGAYELLIPAEVFTPLAPGTFWIDVMLKEQIGRFNRVRDRRALAARIPISMDSSGMAPEIVNVRRDSEKTYPYPINIMKV